MFTSKIGLPRAARPTRLGQATVKRIPVAPATSRVLIVDADRKVGVALTFMLAARLYDDVRAVRSAQRALAIAVQFRPEIVFLDLELPAGDGLSVARQLVQSSRPIRPRLIALTNHVEHLMRE